MAKGRLIAEVLGNRELRKVFSEVKNFMDFAKTAEGMDMNDTVRKAMITAHDFSELLYGAHLAYNCQLQKMVFNSNVFEAEFARWAKNLEKTMIDYSNFDLESVLTLIKKNTSVSFVMEWWKQSEQGFRDRRKRDELIRDQEARVKGNKARLQWKKTDDIKEGDWIGLSFFDYRFRQAKTILNDIMQGLTR